MDLHDPEHGQHLGTSAEVIFGGRGGRHRRIVFVAGLCVDGQWERNCNQSLLYFVSPPPTIDVAANIFLFRACRSWRASGGASVIALSSC